MIRPIYDQAWSKTFYEWLQPRANIEVDDYTTIGFLDDWDNIVGVIIFSNVLSIRLSFC